jgi:hypothetical protein
MDHSVSELFIILAINPKKGRVTLNNMHFRLALAGAIIMDFLALGEVRIDNKRIIPSFKENGNKLHDTFAGWIMKSRKNRRISFWIKRLGYKNRFTFREIINKLEKERVIRIERKKFLNFIPYSRYWLTDISIRKNLIERLRGILLYSKKPEEKDIMLLGLVDTSRAYSHISMERGESRKLRKLNAKLLKGEVISAEINQAIREIQAAVVLSITAASAAAHGSH